MIEKIQKTLAAALLACLIPATGGAAIQNAPAEDIDYMAEHLPEAAMNNRYLTLPYATPQLNKGQWSFIWQPGYSGTNVDFINLNGWLFSASAGYAMNDRCTVRALGFFDKLRFSGGSGQKIMNPLFLKPTPLDLPEYANFSNPRGDYLHYGFGAAVDWTFLKNSERHSYWTSTFEVLWDRLDLRHYAFDYQLLTGADAGASGVLDHSATYDYITPLFSLQYTKHVGNRFALSPRWVTGVPIPKRSWVGRLTGPGFDVSGDTNSVGNGKHMGDPFSGFGLAVQHLPSGLAIDIGATVNQFFLEKKVHKGIDHDVVVSVSWSFLSVQRNDVR